MLPMLYPTRIPGLFAMVSWNEDGEKIRATAKASDARGIPIDGLPTRSSRWVNLKRKQHAVTEAIAKIERVYRAVYADNPLTEDNIRDAVDRLMEECRSGARHLRHAWKDTATNTRAMTFFVRNSLDLIIPYIMSDQIFLESDRTMLFDKLVELSLPRVKGDVQTARENAYKRMTEIDIIYANLKEILPSLPDITFEPSEPVKPAPKKEQLKTLPRTVLTKFYQRLAESVDTAAKYVFFSVLVVFGLRPAEAAAQKPCDILFFRRFCIVRVRSQVKKGVITPKLKNEYSRRPVIISFWGRSLLQLCKDAIGEDYPHDETTPMHLPTICARWVKELLLSCGCQDQQLTDLAADLTGDDFDDDDDDDELSPSARKSAKIGCYILRRIFAGICRSVMGLSMNVTDRLLGHKLLGINEKASVIDLNAFCNQAIIAEKMERYIFDPRYSLNPSCTPLQVSELLVPSDDEALPGLKEIIPFSEFVLINDTDEEVLLDITLECAELGESIVIDCPNEPNMLNHTSLRRSWLGRDREVIGDTTLHHKEAIYAETV